MPKYVWRKSSLKKSMTASFKKRLNRVKLCSQFLKSKNKMNSLKRWSKRKLNKRKRLRKRRRRKPS